MHVFQRGLFNTNKELCDIREMYFRTNTDTEFKDYFTLNKDDYFETNTYFNSISVGKLKKYTTINDISFNINFLGKIKLNFFHLGDHLALKELFSQELYADTNQDVKIPISDWENLDEGMLYFRIVSLEESRLYDFFYSTDSPAQYEVKLAIVITHFNRQNYLLSALERMSKELFTQQEYSNIDIIISDNSQNLNFTSNEKIKVFKNKNYGGSGGFTFGLLKAHELDYTHCLFMDDDASTETESILRTYNLLQYAATSNMAVAGAMCYEDKKNIQYESGAVLGKKLEPIHHNFNLLNLQDLTKNNKIVERANYAGWWFFGFPIKYVKNMPFPFFVRGDDVAFGLMNNFELLFINGICSWQENFLYKDNQFLHYQYIRSMLILYYSSLWRIGILRFLYFIFYSLIANGLKYRYDLMQAVVMAIEDIISVDQWDENICMEKKRSTILESNYIIKKFRIEDLKINSKELNYINSLKSNYQSLNIGNISNIKIFINKIFSMIIFMLGFQIIIPTKILKKRRKVYSINSYRIVNTFFTGSVLLVFDKDMVMLLEINKKKFIYLILKFIFLIPKIVIKNNRNKRKFKEFFIKYTTRVFWLKTLTADK